MLEWSLEELADRANTTPKTIWKYEAGQNLSLVPLIRLTKIMGKSLFGIIYDSLPNSEKNSSTLQYFRLIPLFQETCVCLLRERTTWRERKESFIYTPALQYTKEFMFTNVTPQLHTAAFPSDYNGISDDDLTIYIANNLSKFMSINNISAGHLAGKLQVSPGTIQNYKSNGTLQLNKLFRLARALNVPIFYFFEPWPEEFLHFLQFFQKFNGDHFVCTVINKLTKVQHLLINNVLQEKEGSFKHHYRVVIDLKSTELDIFSDPDPISFHVALYKYELPETLIVYSEEFEPELNVNDTLVG